MSTAPDQPIREQALDIGRSYIVQAPAGSGKTELLIQRYLKLLAHSDEPEQVLAITFTRKAAAEMRHRVMSALQSATGSPSDLPPGSEHERLTRDLACQALQRSEQQQWNLQAQPARLRIMTIDSLNGSLVRSMPWLSGTGTDVMIDPQPQRLYEEAAWQTLDIMNAGRQTQMALRTLLLHLDNNDRRVCSLIVNMLGRRDHWLRYLVPLKAEKKTRQQLSKMFEQVIEEQLHNIAALIPDNLADEMIRIAAIGGERLHRQGDSNKSHIVLKDCKALPEAEFKSLRLWKALVDVYLTASSPARWRSAKSFNKTLGFPPDCDEKPAIGDLCQRLQEEERLLQALSEVRNMPEQIYDDQQWEVLEALIELLPVAVGHLKLVFQRHSTMDFVEQALAAQTALGDAGNVTDLALKLDYQIKHILMDEFQDTSHAQLHLLEKLIAGWQQGDEHSLFLVGDPMQSIYGFREADVSGFLKVRDHGIGSIRPESLVLQANFRSAPELMAWFNEVFPDVLASEDDLALGAISYTPAVAALDTFPESKVVVHAGIDRDSYAEAELIVEQIQQAIEGDSEQTIGVLVRSRSHLRELFPLLIDADVDFQAVDILPLHSEAVTQDLLSVTRTVLHRHDRMAWLAVLRAPWCALTLDTLHAIASRHTEADLWSLLNNTDVLDRLASEDRQRLQRVIDCYRPALEQAEQLSLRTRVEWLWRGLGGEACHQHAQAMDDAATYLDLLDELEQLACAGGKTVTLKSILTELQTLYSSGTSYAGAQVQLMTIHKSKGLEFDTVILPGLERGTGVDVKKLLVWHEELGSDYVERLLLAPIHAPGSNDQSYDYVRMREKRRQAYEAQRLLYVGITRARKQLHLFGALKSDRDGEPGATPKGSFLALLGAHLRKYFLDIETHDNTQDVAEDPGSDANMEGQATIPLYRVPADWEPPLHGENIVWQAPVDIQFEAERIEFSWAGQAARIIGTVTHQYLHLFGDQGLDNWNAARVDQQRDAIASRLISSGLPTDALDDAVQKVCDALTNVIQDKRAAWILESHSQAQTEYAISGVLNGRIVNRIIDRTFIDADGTRWVIDYKTSIHEGGNPEEFLDQEQSRYQQQLQEYAALFVSMGNEPVRLGLYFPLMKGWRSFSYGP